MATMKVQVILQLDAESQEEAEAIVGTWTVTPGTFVTSVGAKMIVRSVTYGGPLAQVVGAPAPPPPMPPLPM